MAAATTTRRPPAGPAPPSQATKTATLGDKPPRLPDIPAGTATASPAGMARRAREASGCARRT
eukprot:11166604-Lingulodinium_polyedra.AAC.1